MKNQLELCYELTVGYTQCKLVMLAFKGEFKKIALCCIV